MAEKLLSYLAMSREARRCLWVITKSEAKDYRNLGKNESFTLGPRVDFLTATTRHSLCTFRVAAALSRNPCSRNNFCGGVRPLRRPQQKKFEFFCKQPIRFS
jgi:hypothetical protein